MRRLFSTFAAGPPAVGLLVLRAAVGAALVAHTIDVIASGASGESILHLACAALGVLLVIGLWTPIAAALGVVDTMIIALSAPREWPFWLLVGAIAFALALLGPGKWSVDARLFGWKRVEFGDREATWRSPK